MSKLTITANSMVIHSISFHNIFPLTSRCNLNCNFCSHSGNPPEAEVYRFPDLSLEEADYLADYLDPNKKIIIGESATRLIEGEPTANPYFCGILKLLRIKFPDTVIQVTTNGSIIDKKLALFLKTLKRVELIVSVSSSKKGEDLDKAFYERLQLLKLLEHNSVPYTASFIPLPSIGGWDFVKDSLVELIKYRPETIRIFLPGFTKFSPADIHYDIDKMAAKMYSVVEKIDDGTTPIIVEPGKINNLKAEVQGVIPKKPAYEAGIRKGDVINSINGSNFFSRVEAFNELFYCAKPAVEYVREKKLYKTVLDKAAETPPGLVFYHDFAPRRVNCIRHLIFNFKVESAVLLASGAGFGRVKLALEKSGLIDKIEILKVDSYFFGGSINCAGLLVVSDFLAALDNFKYKYGQLIIVPEEAFDYRGKDLVGNHFSKIEEYTKIPVVCA